ncbi:radical SAM protein [Gracilinema caldarium]|uniref:Radical SAM domain protein n=1 Tax=Gracilinema caldarium (strain ATCC 51460 / DSM 7334 / H1) TaxID=744872 RepID=F8F1R9_GRAC1|nr:radical SAM protein [Gracilinema caldarium]AEJ19403.1 Radical SAM domain protein [Gracilinema caldarium DSM 7334]
MGLTDYSPFTAPAQALGWDNPPWDAAEVRILFVRLSPWQDVQRSSPHLFLYSLMRKALGEKAFGDFTFLPSRAERKELDNHEFPWMRGIASGKVAVEFDALLISCSYALELINLPLLLQKSGIPLRASQRASWKNSRWPLIIVGGSNALANQGLIFSDGDSFADGLYFGEAEANPGGKELFSLIAQLREINGSDKRTILEQLEAALPSFWAYGHHLYHPSPGHTLEDSHKNLEFDRLEHQQNYREIHPARSYAFEHPFLPEAYPILNSPEASTARLQISWGCPSFCTFCFEGWERKPYREVPRDRILEMAKNLIRHTGASTLELYSFNFNAHSDILSLLVDLNRIFDRVNMMSQRADILVNTPGMLECELSAEKRAFTIGVEGISEGMRAFYAKGLSTQDLWHLIERLFQEKAREIKLFYILSGFETESDITEFIQFCQRLKELTEQHRPRPRLLFSAGYLVRMPFTPLRYAPLELDRKKLETISSAIATAVEGAGFEYRLAMDWDEYVVDQLLVLGDYRLAEILERAAERGILYDGGIRGSFNDMIYQTYKDDLGPQSPFTGEKNNDYPFSLSFVQTSINNLFLYRTYIKARERQKSELCFGGNQGDGHCMGCGSCRVPEEQSFLIGHRISGDPVQTKAKQIAELIRAKRRIRPQYIKVRLGESYRGAYPEYLSALLLHQVLTKKPDLTGKLFRITEALWTSPTWKDRIGWGFYGETVLAVYGFSDDSSPDDSPMLNDIILQDVLEALSNVEATLCTEDREAFYPQHLEISFPALDLAAALTLCRKWLASLKVAYTERKGTLMEQRVFEIAPKDTKKRILSEATLRWDDKMSIPVISIYGGPKLDISYLVPTEGHRFSVSICIKKLAIKQ